LPKHPVLQQSDFAIHGYVATGNTGRLYQQQSQQPARQTKNSDLMVQPKQAAIHRKG